MIRGIITVGGWTMASRIAGFVRDMIFAAVLGTGPVGDAFFVAQKLPNLFRRLFGEGAFNAAFVPSFSGLAADKGHPAAHRFARDAFALMAVWLLFLTVLGEIFMPQLMAVLAPGFAVDPAKLALTITLTRITFPYLLLICLVALLSGMLNGLDFYAAAAAAPVLYNVVCIGFMLGLTPYLPTAGHAFAWGVTASGVVMLAMLLIAVARAGMPIKLEIPRLTPEMRSLLRRMAPGMVGAGVMQINQMVDVFIATLLPASSVSLIYYANQVQQLPLAIIGTAIGTALLPLLSRQVRTGDDTGADATMNRAMEYALFLTLPATFALVSAAEPVVSALFQRGAFTHEAARLSAQALVAYAVGLPAFVMVKVMAPGFFARGDTTTPVVIGVGCVAINVVLNLLLMTPLQHVGPPLATSIASWINLAALAFVLHRRKQLHLDRQLQSRAPRILLAALTMGAAVWMAADYAPGGRYARLVLLVTLGLAIYFGSATLVGAMRLHDLQRLLRRRTQKVTEQGA